MLETCLPFLTGDDFAALFDEPILEDDGGERVMLGTFVDATFFEVAGERGLACKLCGGVCAALDRCNDTRADFRGEYGW